MFLKTKVALFAFAVSAFSFNALALEPLNENRARISSLHGTLLLPDYSNLDFDMSFDCGSRWEDTAMIITSEAGAQLLAASYTHLWGEEAGKLVMQTWNNKVNEDDPRLPTFMVVTPPESGLNFTQSMSDKKSSRRSKRSLNNVIPPAYMPMLTGTCGTRSHNVE